MFRGKDKNGNWVYGGINDTKTCIIKQYQFIPVEPSTVGRCTGLKDSQGNLIYEGDILQNKYDKIGNSIEEVFWNEETGAFNTKRVHQPYTDSLHKEYIEKYMVIRGDSFENT